METVFQQDAGVAAHAAHKAHEHGGSEGNVAGCRSNHDEACQGTGNSAERSGLACADPFHEQPSGHTKGGRKMRGGEGVGGEGTGGQGRAGIKAEPAEPQEAASNEGHRQIMRSSAGQAAPQPRSHSLGAGQGCSRGSHVHDSAAGKVNRAHLGHPAAAPDPVSHRSIGKEHPEAGKKQHGGEMHAFRVAARNQGDSQAGKHALEHHEAGMGEVGG